METRRCPYCAEEIQPAAKRCPHCRAGLGRMYAVFYEAFQDPTKRILLAGLLVAFVFPLRAYFGPKIDRAIAPEAREFSSYPGAIVAESSKMAFSFDGKVVFVVGQVRNKSEIPWRAIEVQVEFLDKDKKFLDRVDQTLYETLGPGQATSFKAAAGPVHDPSKYRGYKVHILSANDASMRW